MLNEIKNVDCLHAGMTIKEREDSVTRMRNGDTWVLISTEVMARGMDFKGIREIINYDFPTSVQSYIHRIGQSTSEISCFYFQRLIYCNRTDWKSWEGRQSSDLFHG